MIHLLFNYLVLVLGVFLAVLTVPGIEAKSGKTIWVVALVYGILNVVVWWVFSTLLTLGSILTLGLLGLAVNSLLLYVTDLMVEEFKIKGIAPIIVGALIITVSSVIFHTIF